MHDPGDLTAPSGARARAGRGAAAAGGAQGARGDRAGRGAAAGGGAPGAGGGAPLIRARGLVAGYGGEAVLDGVTFEVRRGERVGVIGPNGGGKTTLLRALLGELAPLGGTLEVGGRCGTVPQTERSRLDYPVSALDVVLMGALARLPWWRRPGREERRAALAALGRVGLEDRAKATFGELSGGQRQRVLVARALLQDADVVLFDEPFTGLDAPSADALTQLLDALAHEGRAVVVVTHDVVQALTYDAVLCLNRRQIAFGPPADTLTPDTLEATYGRTLVRLATRV
jgi:ABC-type Mn2+/Zn2+ transport system ATPase subunit